MTAYSGVERHRLKYAATIDDEALSDETDADYELQYVDIGSVDFLGEYTISQRILVADAPSRARRRVRDGDVIISCVRTYLQAIAPVQDLPDNLIVSTGFAVVRPCAGVLDTAFGRYVLREPSFLAEVEKRSVGVSYPAVNASDLGDIPVHLPPEPDQRAIADYLDRETARLDALVAAKERVLALLAEKRRAFITCAVTRGLDPRVSLRDSSIPWLGEVPVHWTVTRLKFVACVQTGIALGKSFGNKLVREYPYLRVANVQDGYLDLAEVKSIAVPAEEAFLYHLRAGDVLMNEGGDADKLGRGAIWTGQTDSDFRSQRAEKPSYRFRGVTECQVRGLSVFAARQDAERALRLPNLQGCLVCGVQLEVGAGHIQQTGRPSHHTWWPLAAFNILARCGMGTS